MPVDTFHRDFIELIDRRRWDRKTGREVDRDMEFVISMCLEIYMNGRRPPGPRPLREAVEMRGEPPPPQSDEPRILFGAFGFCARNGYTRSRRRTPARRRR
jgi:hypothetical protein